MKRLLLILVILLSVSLNRVQAQEYRSSIGIGLGADLSVNYRHFITERSALELQGSFNSKLNGLMFSMVYQYNVRMIGGLSFYFGGGFNVGALYLNHKSNADFAIGLAPTVGFEYSFANAPIALALDYKPNINFTTVKQLDLLALKVRFTW